MPSQLHEALLLLFRNRPALAPELLRDALRITLPQYSDVRIDSAELTDVQPAEYRADLVVLLLEGVPVLGIVVEAQLSPDERKRDLGGGNVFSPLVLGPSGVPEITDEKQAREDPELAVLSAMAHGQDTDYGKAARIALAAQFASLGLDEDRSRLYFDLVRASLSEAARKELKAMDPAKYEYQSEFAKRYFAQGQTEGRAHLVRRLLSLRFGALPPEALARITAASIEDLDAIGERLLTAQTLQEALGASDQ